MADQQQNPYAPSKLSGPFADQLDPTIVSAPHQSPGQFSGYAGKTGNLLGIADKFLAGLGQGRMLAALAQEKEKAKLTSLSMSAYQEFADDPNVDPVKKAEIGQKFQQSLFSEAAGDIKKTKGQHPILDAMGHIIGGLAGGEVKKSKQDPNAMKSIMGDMAAARIEGAKQYATSGNPLQNAISQEIKAATDAGKQPNRSDIAASVQSKFPQLITDYDRRFGQGSGLKLVDSATERLPSAPAERKLTPKEEEQKRAAENFKKAQGQQQQPQPPGAQPAPPGSTNVSGSAMNTGAYQASPKVTSQIPGLPPPPPGTGTPKLMPEARAYLQAYGQLTAPVEMIDSSGNKRQVIYTNGAEGIDPGFIDAGTGEYINGPLHRGSQSAKPTYKIAKDEKGKYGDKGGEYYVDESTGKPMKDKDGDIVRPREQATSVGQKAVTSAIQREYDTYTSGLNGLDKEAESRIAGIEKEKDAMGQPKYSTATPPPTKNNPNPISPYEAKKKEIYNGVIKRKEDLKRQTANKIDNIGHMFGVPVQPFMDSDQQQALGMAEDKPESGSASEFSFPKEVEPDSAEQWNFSK